MWLSPPESIITNMVPIKHYTTDKRTPETLENDLIKRITRLEKVKLAVLPPSGICKRANHCLGLQYHSRGWTKKDEGRARKRINR